MTPMASRKGSICDACFLALQLTFDNIAQYWTMQAFSIRMFDFI